MKKRAIEKGLYVNREERLNFHQLRLLEWMEKQPKKTSSISENSQLFEVARSNLRQLRLRDIKYAPRKVKKSFVEHVGAKTCEETTSFTQWRLTKGVTLYKWQRECVEEWFQNSRRGTVKVVTGGGKTILALAIAERLHNEENPELRVAIVVPTIVLLNQWYDEILEKGNLPSRLVGRLGGGFLDDFEKCRILVCVLKSAHTKLPGLVRANLQDTNLLLVVDECHRSGAAQMSKLYETRRSYNLGLSATPERDDDEEKGYNESKLGNELGPIIFDFNLKNASGLNIVPQFTIRHYGLSLFPNERTKYNNLSKRIRKSKTELQRIAPRGKDSFRKFNAWVNAIAGNSSRQGELASRLVADRDRRKQILYQSRMRGEAVENLLEKEFEKNRNTQVILFHERINQVMDLFVRLKVAGYPVIAEHSRIPGSLRKEGLDLFRQGIAQVIVSARSLIEGFNVPAADVGIIVASSTSVRQRIQSLGRVLRRHQRNGRDMVSVVHVLYNRDTVDEEIYAKVDWDQITGKQQNIYFHWENKDELRKQDNPPKSPLPSEFEIDVSKLKAGDDYPGRYEGEEFTCDTQGNIKNSSDDYAIGTKDLSDKIQNVKLDAGRFRITPRRKFVLVRVIRQHEWKTLFVSRLRESLEFGVPSLPPKQNVDLSKWVKTASPGESYPCTNPSIKDKSIRFGQKRGGVLARPIKGGKKFARVGNAANNPDKGAEAKKLIEDIKYCIQRKSYHVTKLEITELNHVLFRKGGRLVFIRALETELEF